MEPTPDFARQDFLRRLRDATRQGQVHWYGDPLPHWNLPWNASCLHNGEALFWLWSATPGDPVGLAALEQWGPRWLATAQDCPRDLLFDMEQAITESASQPIRSVSAPA